MTTVRKGSTEDPRSLAARIRNLETQLGMDDQTHLIDPAIGQASQRWALFEDSNADAYTGIDADDQLLALMPVFDFIGTRGQWVGWFTVRATVSGSGVARARLYDYIASAFVSECEWLFYFNSATTSVLVMNGHHALKSLSGQKRYGLVVDRESGTGTFDVGVDDGKLSVLVVGQTGSGTEPVPGSEEFEYAGSPEYFTVPANVFEVTVTMYGGAGSNNGGSQGLGGYIKCSVPVTPGQVIEVRVGGSGDSGGYNGGGDANGFNYGGGASDIRLYPYALGDRLVVAGGGGGASAAGQAGGHGGYTDGLAGVTSTGGAAAGGGTQSAGGAAGTVNGFGTAPTAGASGQGGDGGYEGSRYGGGGGGGYYGGGGGAANVGTSGQGSGGGGSSFYDSGAGVVLIEETDGGGPTGNTATVLFEW